MTYLTLTATPQSRAVAGNTPVNLTSLLTAGALGSNSGVEWQNTNREVLYVQQGTAASDVTVAIGATVEGEPVTSITYTGVASAIQVIGPFDTVEESAGMIQVTFATPADITGVALLSNSGAL